MSNRSQRSFRKKHAHTIAKVAGIIIALIGVFFIAIVGGETDARNAKCTEKTIGIVSDVKASGSKYLNTIEYVGDDVDCSVTAEISRDLGVGSEIEVFYEPLTPKHAYIEGVSQTGKKNVIEGIVMILVGAAFVVAGIFLKKLDTPKPDSE